MLCAPQPLLQDHLYRYFKVERGTPCIPTHHSMVGPVVALGLGTAHNAVCLRWLLHLLLVSMKYEEMSQLGTPASIVLLC